MTPAFRIIDRASFWLARLCSLAVVLMTVGFILALLLQVVFRYLLDAPLSWSEELATLLFVWAALLAAATAVRFNQNLRLTFLEDLLPGRPARMLGWLRHVLAAGFGAFLVRDGWRLAELVWTNTSAAIGYPMWMLYLSVPVTGGLLVLHSAACLGADLSGTRPDAEAAA